MLHFATIPVINLLIDSFNNKKQDEKFIQPYCTYHLNFSGKLLNSILFENKRMEIMRTMDFEH